MINDKVRNKIIRIRKMLRRILDWTDDCCYWDDAKDDVVFDGTKDDLYDYIMEDDDMHLLGSDYVRLVIDLYFEDYSKFEILLRNYNAY